MPCDPYNYLSCLEILERFCFFVLQIPVSKLIQFQIWVSLKVPLQVNEVTCTLSPRECMYGAERSRTLHTLSLMKNWILLTPIQPPDKTQASNRGFSVVSLTYLSFILAWNYNNVWESKLSFNVTKDQKSEENSVNVSRFKRPFLNNRFCNISEQLS